MSNSCFDPAPSPPSPSSAPPSSPPPSSPPTPTPKSSPAPTPTPPSTPPTTPLLAADAHPEIVSGAKPIPPMDPTGERGPGVPEFRVQAGYRVEALTGEFRQTEVRFLQFDNFGTLYVSSHKYGTITSFKKQ